MFYNKKALVVIDMQNDFVTGVLGTKEAQAIVPNVIEYIKNFDGDVYYTRDTHTTDYMDTQEGKNLPVPHCIKNTEGWQIVPEVENACQKLNTYKTIYNKDTFGSVGLATELCRKGYQEIYFIGVCTGICVISNVLMVKAFLPEAKLIVKKDLCACVTPTTHETALEAMKLCQVDVQ